MESAQITLELDPDPADVGIVRAGLSAYNGAQASDDAFSPLALLVRDPEGKVIGGLLGGTYWGWLVVEVLWIAEEARKQGLGSRLLERAEEIAIERNCHGVHLDTMSFQAPDFYRRHGYTVFGVLEDLPRGQRRFFMKKELRGGGGI